MEDILTGDIGSSVLGPEWCTPVRTLPPTEMSVLCTVSVQSLYTAGWRLYSTVHTSPHPRPGGGFLSDSPSEDL